jgi:hypothetical protein
MTKKIHEYIWTLEIKVQGKNEAEATKYIRDRIIAFLLRGLSVEEGKIKKVETE